MEVKQVGKLIKCYGDCIIASDPHIPIHDNKWLSAIIEEGKFESINSIILAGDVWDMLPFSNFDSTSQTWKQIKKESRKFFTKLQEQFETIVVLIGNHEKWFSRNSKNQMSMEDMVELLIPDDPSVDLFYTDWDYCILDDKIRVSHAKTYSEKPHFTPEKLGKKYRMSCFQAHDHMLAFKSVTRNGKTRYYVNLGCGIDYNKAEYEIGTTSTYGQWGKGFVSYVDGRPDIVTDEKHVSYREYCEIIDGVENGYITEVWERSDR